MTTKALLRTSTWDWDRARDHLREHATAATAEAGGRTIRAIPEPLLRHHDSAGLLQSIRLDGLEGLPRVVVRNAHGVEIFSDVIREGRILRVLVPEPSEPTSLTLEVPDVVTGLILHCDVEPPRHWEIHLVHHSHLDIGYTDPQGTVTAQHLSYLDSVLDLVRQTDGWDDDAQFRWVVESLWSFDEWRRQRPASSVSAFLDRVREGRIELTALPFNLHTEACSSDELHELTRLAADVRHRWGIDITAAMQTDVPGAVGGLVDVLADQGVRYLSVAHNWAGRSVPHLTGGQDLPRLFRWRSTADSEVLVWMTDTPHGLAYMEGPVVGFDVSYDLVDDVLPSYLNALATRSYPLDASAFGFLAADVPLHRKPYPWDLLHLRVQGHFGDNAPPRRIVSETVREWNSRWAFPHLRVSRNVDFFAEAERRLGPELQTFTGDWNDWWADGLGSGARPLQLARRGQATLPDALTISTLAGLRGAAEADGDTEAAREIYLNAALFDEHTWGSANPWTHSDDGKDSGAEQWHWKYYVAISTHDQANALKERALARLATTLPSTEALATAYVVNTSDSPRGGIVDLFVPESRVPLDVPLAVIDSETGASLPTEERDQPNSDHRESGRFVRIAVGDIPPLSLHRLHLTASEVPKLAASRPAGTILENDRLRVTVDLATASIGSIVHKPTGEELVNTSATFGFNAYIYDRYATAGGINHQSSKTEAGDNLALIATRSLARPAALVDSGRNAVRQWVTYETVAPGAEWVRTTVILPLPDGPVRIENRVRKPATMDKESAFFAFPFVGDDPTMRFETSASVAGDDIPFVPGGATHMRAMRHWVSLYERGLGIAWASADSALIQRGAIVVPYVPFPQSTPAFEPATVFAWVHNNLWDTNFPSLQEFEMTFHYVVDAAPADDADGSSVFASLVAADLVRPLSAVLAPAEADLPLSAPMPAIRVDDNRIRLVGLTTPTPGQVLVRLQSTVGTSVRCPVSCSPAPARAWTCSFLGEALEPLDLLADDGGTAYVDIAPFGTGAVILEPS